MKQDMPKGVSLIFLNRNALCVTTADVSFEVPGLLVLKLTLLKKMGVGDSMMGAWKRPLETTPPFAHWWFQVRLELTDK